MPDVKAQESAVTITLKIVFGFAAVITLLATYSINASLLGDPVDKIRGAITIGFGFTIFTLNLIGLAVLERHS